MMQPSQKSIPRSLRATLALLMLASSTLLIGCKTKVVVIPADRAAVRLEAGKPYAPAVPGYFVPDARMLEILKALEERVEQIPK